MSFNNFKIVDYFGTNKNGTPILHNTLTNPITGAGTFCRSFGDSGQELLSMTISSSYNNGSLVGIGGDKSVSIRTLFRRTGTPAGFEMFAKAANQYGVGAAWTGVYSLVLGFNATGFRFKSGGARGNFNRSTSASDIFQIENNTWYPIRMDIIPCTVQKNINGVIATSPYKDIINVYTGSGPVGNETWSLVYTKEILTTDNDYVPWGNYIITNTGFGDQSVTSSVGFCMDTVNGYYNTSGKYLIDRFEVYTGSV